MLKVIAFIKRKPGTSHADFRRYYEATHRHQVKHLAKEVVKVTWSFPRKEYDPIVNAFHQPTESGAEKDVIFDSVTEMWVKDEEALKRVYAILRSAEVNTEIRADEENFLDQGALQVQVYDELVAKLDDY